MLLLFVGATKWRSQWLRPFCYAGHAFRNHRCMGRSGASSRGLKLTPPAETTCREGSLAEAGGGLKNQDFIQRNEV